MCVERLLHIYVGVNVSTDIRLLMLTYYSVTAYIVFSLLFEYSVGEVHEKKQTVMFEKAVIT